MNTTRLTLQIYWQHARRYPKSLAILLGAMPIVQFVEDFLVPLLISYMMNKLIHAQHGVALSHFILPLTFITIFELGINFAWRPYVKTLWRFEENVMRDLLQTSFKHLMSMSYRFHTNHFGGSLVSQTNKFMGSFERLTDALVWNVYKLIIAFVFTVIILAFKMPLYVAFLTFFSLLYVVILIQIKKTEHPLTKEWAKAESKRTGQLADSITNVLAVKSFGREALEQKLFQDRTDTVFNHSMKTMRRTMHNEMYTITSQRFIGVSAILISIILASKLTIAVGTIYLALTYTLGITRRLWDLNSTIRNFMRVFGDAHEMTEILQIEPEVKDPEHPQKPLAKSGSIDFKNVTFAYKENDREPLFDTLNLHIKAGEKIGLVGHSGGGKTTITKLLLRFMDIQHGEILIDEQNIARLKQEDLRGLITYVPQEPLMFHRNLLDNISYGNLKASNEQIYKAAKLAHAHEFIEKLPDRYNTLVGERGTKLSGGQKQRIAIARAMIKDAPILVLDEATSALDSESEKLIQSALWELMKGRTAIVIAHRLSTIQKMDRIIVLDEGKIVEEGSHTELIKRKGVYAQLWEHQSGGFIEE